MMQFKEIETKYSADHIALTAFDEFCRGRKPKKVIMPSGYDHFYSKKNEGDSFCRLRVGSDINQLTFKRKTKDDDNFVRSEHNINLTSEITKDQIEAFISEFGYEYNTTLFKTCFVYKYEFYTLVYYIVYDADLNEQGRFIEIEMSEDHVWESETQAWNELLLLEKLCKPIGLNPKGRVKKSLFEMFKK